VFKQCSFALYLLQYLNRVILTVKQTHRLLYPEVLCFEYVSEIILGSLKQRLGNF